MPKESKQLSVGEFRSCSQESSLSAGSKSKYVGRRHCGSEASSCSSEAENPSDESPSDTVAKLPPWWTKEDPRLPDHEKPYRLKSFVRSKYLLHLQKLLQSNYENCIDNDPTQDLPEFSDWEFEQCAAAMELKAVQACMVVSLYRKFMLRMIGEIRNETSHCQLYRKLKTFQNANPRRDVSTQTVFTPALTEKCSKLNRNMRDIKSPHNKINILNIPLPPKNIDIDFELETYALGGTRNSAIASCSTDSEVQIELAINPTSSVNKKMEEKLSLDDRLAHLIGESPKIDHLKLIKSEHLFRKVSGIQSGTRKFHMQELDKSTRDKPVRPRPKIRPICLPSHTDVRNKSINTMKSTGSKILKIDHKKSVEYNRDNSIEVTQIVADSMKNDAEEDKLLKELEEMFKENECDNPENEIFNICGNDIEIKGIINEINKNKQTERATNENTEKCKVEVDNQECQKDDKMCDNDLNIGKQTKHTFSKQNSTNPFLLKNGKYSLWPCELHMQRKRLRMLLDAISEINPRKRDMLKIKFVALFDEDSEDEQEIEDPIVNKIHELSCKERIATWVVGAVMPHYLNQKIDGKELFKSVSRHLAQSLIHLNPYPDKDEVYSFIRSYFHKRSTIKTHQDIFVKLEDTVFL